MARESKRAATAEAKEETEQSEKMPTVDTETGEPEREKRETEQPEPQGAPGEQQSLPVVDELIRAQIAKELELTYAFQEARMDAGKSEKEHRANAYALMEKYGIEGEFVHGAGETQIRGFFETKKKLKVRKGEKAEGDGSE